MLYPSSSIVLFELGLISQGGRRVGNGRLKIDSNTILHFLSPRDMSAYIFQPPSKCDRELQMYLHFFRERENNKLSAVPDLVLFKQSIAGV